jgi:3-oxoacid CoA-transferase subunit A
MTHFYPDAAAAYAGVLRDGMTVLAGGFGLCGIPEHGIATVHAMGARDLHVVSNNCGVPDQGLGILLRNGQLAAFTGSYVGENPEVQTHAQAGTLTVTLVPQGTLAERLRAGGAGIPAFYTPVGAGTVVAEGKETRTLEGRTCLLEHALHGDIAMVKGWKADRLGNVVYRKAARNFNPVMATAATLTIVEVEEIVEVGTLDPEAIHTPSIFVHRCFVGAAYTKTIEHPRTHG